MRLQWLLVACLILPTHSFSALQRHVVVASRSMSPAVMHMTTKSKNEEPGNETNLNRRSLLATAFLGLLSGTVAHTVTPQTARAAPPIAIIAEELGYFPVTNSQNKTVYVAKRVQRESSDQAVQLAQKLTDSGAAFYGAYWCPHCARQKELLGRQAFQKIRNVECAPQGYQAQPTLCATKQIDGFPTWILGNGERISGERPLSDLARAVGMKKFDESLEKNLPAPLGSASCK